MPHPSGAKEAIRTSLDSSSILITENVPLEPSNHCSSSCRGMLLSLAVFAYPAFPPHLISAFLRRDRSMSLANNRRAWSVVEARYRYQRECREKVQPRMYRLNQFHSQILLLRRRWLLLEIRSSECDPRGYVLAAQGHRNHREKETVACL